MRNAARKIALTALVAAMLSAVKFALSFAANVELVTLLIGVFTATFGLAVTLPATLIFIAADTLIYGVGTWVISYLVYWPLLAAAFALCRAVGGGDLKYKLTAVIFTVFFGVLTSLVDTGLFTGFYEDFWMRFAVLYVRGVPFFAVHIVNNILTFAILFSPVKRTLLREGRRLRPRDEKTRADSARFALSEENEKNKL